jgi:hypothetical protein
MSHQPTVRIWHENLAAMAVDERRPLSELAADMHIHGGLRLEIAGSLVPYLGYWGSDDVCFGQWLDELRQAAAALAHRSGRHIFDEGEQGQPAFIFQRDGDRAFFTIAASEISDGLADAGWQRVDFNPDDFIAAYEQFVTSFCEELLAASPSGTKAWLTRFAPELLAE